MSTVHFNKLLQEITGLSSGATTGIGSPDREVLYRIYVALFQTVQDSQHYSTALFGGLDASSYAVPQYYTTTQKPIDLGPIIEALELYLGIRTPKAEEEKVPKLYIIVDGGDTFEGTSEQWAECYFSNVTEEGVIDFCHQNGWEVTITRME